MTREQVFLLVMGAAIAQFGNLISRDATMGLVALAGLAYAVLGLSGVLR